MLWDSCKLGVAAFVGEMSSAIITTVFNFLLLKEVGNIGIAAYGIVANLSAIAMALFNGIAQGMQPLVSESYGRMNIKEVHGLLRLGLITGITLELILVGAAFLMTDSLVAIFNSAHVDALAEYAHVALRLYFLGYLFAGINIVMVSYFAAIGEAISASIASILRGIVAVLVFAIGMAAIWGLNGIWLSFMAAEGTTSIVIALLYIVRRKNMIIVNAKEE